MLPVGEKVVDQESKDRGDALDSFATFYSGFLKIAFLALTWGSVFLCFLTPALKSSSNEVLRFLGFLGQLLYLPFCHQQEQRCFFVAGEAMPLCTRCFGIVLGCALASTYSHFHTPQNLKRLRRSVFLAAAMLIFDWSLGVLGIHQIGEIRFLTGIVLGVSIALILAFGLASMPSEAILLKRRDKGLWDCF